jgi:hypothetical protein
MAHIGLCRRDLRWFDRCPHTLTSCLCCCDDSRPTVALPQTRSRTNGGARPEHPGADNDGDVRNRRPAVSSTGRGRWRREKKLLYGSLDSGRLLPGAPSTTARITSAAKDLEKAATSGC